jgi:hypothetical protein
MNIAVYSDSNMTLSSFVKPIRTSSQRIMLTMMLFVIPVFFASPPSRNSLSDDEIVLRSASSSDSLEAASIENIVLAQGAASFGVSLLTGHTLTQPTSLQFGPDGRLYVLRKKSIVNVLEVNRIGTNNYQVVSEEVLSDVRGIPNHNDDGTFNPDEKLRQVVEVVHFYVTP